MLKPETFLALLQKGKKKIQNTYRDFFTTLAKIFDYYDELSIEHRNKHQKIIKNDIKERLERQRRREKRKLKAKNGIIKKKNKTIEKKTDKIDELKTLLLDMKKTNERMESKIDEMSKDLKFVISKTTELPRKESLHNVLCIMKEPVTKKRYEKYHIVRCQVRSYKKLVQDKKDKYGAKVLFNISTNNGILCWQSMKGYFETNKKFVSNSYGFKYRGHIDSDILKEVLSNSIKNIKTNVSKRY
jgi:hypothetical protein